MSRFILYEIHARSWLRACSERLGRRIGLGEVPDEELKRWRDLGFTHLWLMGIWAISERSRRLFLELPGTVGQLHAQFPGWNAGDVPGSPYAIAGYRVPDELGGETGLQQLRGRLHAHGLRLLLDFIPNHVGLDHPWVRAYPERFVGAAAPGPERFAVETEAGRRWLAHGKDPFFPAWMDTLQLDYRRADTRSASIAELRSLVGRCDGVRCDMAMLVLADVFARTWHRWPCPEPAPGEFWAEARQAVRGPDFVFLAEAYWDLEERLQALGFDYVYDKRVTDYLMGRDSVGLQQLLRGRTREFLRRSVHFLENHDEPRVAGRLTLAEHRAAALLMMGLPGLALLHDGQLAGARVRASIHLNRRAGEAPDAAIAQFYERLLAAIGASAVGRGEGIVIHPHMPDPGSELRDQVIMVAWEGSALGSGMGEPAFDLVLINFSEQGGRGGFDWPGPLPYEEVGRWRVRDRLSEASPSFEVAGGSTMILEIPAHAAQLLEFRAVEGKW